MTTAPHTTTNATPEDVAQPPNGQKSKRASKPAPPELLAALSALPDPHMEQTYAMQYSNGFVAFRALFSSNVVRRALPAAAAFQHDISRDASRRWHLMQGSDQQDAWVAYAARSRQACAPNEASRSNKRRMASERMKNAYQEFLVHGEEGPLGVKRPAAAAAPGGSGSSSGPGPTRSASQLQRQTMSAAPSTPRRAGTTRQLAQSPYSSPSSSGSGSSSRFASISPRTDYTAVPAPRHEPVQSFAHPPQSLQYDYASTVAPQYGYGGMQVQMQGPTAMSMSMSAAAEEYVSADYATGLGLYAPQDIVFPAYSHGHFDSSTAAGFDHAQNMYWSYGSSQQAPMMPLPGGSEYHQQWNAQM